jgi:hypothetical protein
MVSFPDAEAWRNVSWNVGVPLLIPARARGSPSKLDVIAYKNHESIVLKSCSVLPLILLHKMEVVPADNDSPIHLVTVPCSSNNSASDGNCSSE